MTPRSKPPDRDSEKKTVLRAIKGDAEAFGALYTEHLDAIYRYIYFRVGDSVEAEDLTEEVFVKAWEALPGYKVMQYPFKSWLYRIAHNLVVDYHRKRRPLLLPDLDLHGSSTPPSATEDIIERRHNAKVLAAAIQKLGEEEQQVIILRFVEGLSHQEVAEVIGKSQAASRIIQHRALARLSHHLKS